MLQGITASGVKVTRKRLGPTKYRFCIDQDLDYFDTGTFVDAINEEINASAAEAEIDDAGGLIVTFEDMNFGREDLQAIEELLQKSYEEL